MIRDPLACCEHCDGDTYCAENPDRHGVPCPTCREEDAS